MIGKWQCTNPACEDRQKGIVVMSGQPTYAKLVCDKCGHALNRIGGADQVIFVGGHSANVRSAGALPVHATSSGFLRSFFGEVRPPTMDDPDVSEYAVLENVARDPRLLHPDIFTYLQGADVATVQASGKPRTLIVTCCPSHHLAVPYSSSLPAGIHVEAHDVEDWIAFLVYVLLCDNPRDPWFVEHAVFPYDYLGANDEELSLSCRVKWRSLFYLLSQGAAAVLLFLDEKNQNLGLRTVTVQEPQRKAFIALIDRLQKCSGRQIPKPEYFKVHAAKNRVISIDDVRRRFPRFA
ncbi:MAG: hypothetical protein ACRER2_03025 [Methylococcales bacterium]